MKKNLLWLVLFNALTFSAFAQRTGARQLAREKEQLKQQLGRIDNHLQATNRQLQNTQQQHNRVAQEMQGSRQRINHLNNRETGLEEGLRQTGGQLQKLATEIVQWKQAYAASLRQSWKLLNETRVATAVFARNEFNGNRRKLVYLKWLQRQQAGQVMQIRRLQEEYRFRKQQLGQQQQQTQTQLQQQQNGYAQLSLQEQELQQVAGQLEKRRQSLKQTWQKKQKQLARIEKLMQSIVVSVPPVKPPGTKPPAAPRPKTNTQSVLVNFKGNLPCPVNGEIRYPFGIVLINGVRVDNQFITFNTPAPGSPVECVADGEVYSVSTIDETFVVIVQHGSLYTVYGNLQSAAVSKGQQVLGGTTVGRTAIGFDTQKGELEFGVMENRRMLNPAMWISCR